MLRLIPICLGVHVLLAAMSGLSPATGDDPLVSALRQLSRETDWQLAASHSVAFDTYHPQGFARAGDALYLSAVEVFDPPRRYDRPIDGHDRSEGAGQGHLFKMSLEGVLLDETTLGEGALYHPGGIDFDGRYLWVPVAAYRPNSAAIVYRVDPETLESEEVLRFGDHIGGLVADADTLYGVSWGARRVYAWPMSADGRPDAARGIVRSNESHYVDYQDCQRVENGGAICTGVNTFQGPGDVRFRLGGIELLDLRDGSIRHAVPFPYWTESGLPMTQNPTHFEWTGDRLRGYFMPEDNRSRLFVFEATMEF